MLILVVNFTLSEFRLKPDVVCNNFIDVGRSTQKFDASRVYNFEEFMNTLNFVCIYY